MYKNKFNSFDWYFQGVMTVIAVVVVAVSDVPIVASVVVVIFPTFCKISTFDRHMKVSM